MYSFILFKFSIIPLHFIMFLSHISLAFSGCLPSLENIGDEIGIQIWNIKAPNDRTPFVIQVDLEKLKDNVTFFQYNSYIVLKTENVHGNKVHNIHYLHVDRKNVKRIEKTVNCIIELWSELTQKRGADNQVHIIKEYYDCPTSAFRSMFPHFDRFKKLQRMYRLTEQDGHGRIIQVQPKFYKLNTKDVFVLDNDPMIYIIFCVEKNYETSKQESELWKMKYYAAYKLSLFIHNSRNTDTNYTELVQNQSDIRKLFSPSVEIKEEETNIELIEHNNDEILKEDIVLSEYPLDPNGIVKSNSELLNSNIIDSDHLYLLEKPNVREMFIYIKQNPDIELLRGLILYGDTQSTVVSFVRKNKLSAPFITAFQNFNELFFENNINIEKEIENQLP